MSTSAEELMKKTLMLTVAITLVFCGSAFAEKRTMAKTELYKWIDMYIENVEVARATLCEKVKAEKFAKKDREMAEQALRTGCVSSENLLNNLELLMKYPDSIAQTVAVLKEISDTLDSLSILVHLDSDIELRYLERIYYMVFQPHITFYDHLVGLAVAKDMGTQDIMFVK